MVVYSRLVLIVVVGWMLNSSMRIGVINELLLMFVRLMRMLMNRLDREYSRLIWGSDIGSRWLCGVW